jgi:hypothetical protein
MTAHMVPDNAVPGVWHAFPTASAAETWAAQHAVATGQTVYILPTNQEQQ